MELSRWDPFATAFGRWDPFKEIAEMSNRLNRYVGPRAPNGGEQESLTIAQWAPAVDVIEQEKEFLIKAELPDMKKEDVKVSVDDRVMTIKGERKLEKEETGKKFHRIERSYGSFSRSFTLPEDVDAAKVSADYKDGVLNIHLPRVEKPKTSPTEVKIA